jgi:hypothetical protein
LRASKFRAQSVDEYGQANLEGFRSRPVGAAASAARRSSPASLAPTSTITSGAAESNAAPRKKFSTAVMIATIWSSGNPARRSPEATEP